MEQSKAYNPSPLNQSPKQLKDSLLEIWPLNEREVNEKMRKYSNIKDSSKKMPSLVSSIKYTSTDDDGSSSLKNNPIYSEIDKLFKLESEKTAEVSKLRNTYKDIYNKLFKKKHDLIQKREKYISAQRVNNNLKQLITSKMVE